MFSVLSEVATDWVINFLPLETSTKQVGLSLGWMSFLITKLSLAGFEAWVCFINHINPTLAADYLAVRMAIFECLN
jgi:hypothetical protein